MISIVLTSKQILTHYCNNILTEYASVKGSTYEKHFHYDVFLARIIYNNLKFKYFNAILLLLF